MVLVRSDRPVTLLGGADFRRTDLDEALSLAPALVAADGGADAALTAGVTPRAVIGDMDSISDAARAAFAGRLHRVSEQQSTDFDKVLRSVEAPLALAVGFTGGRLDHELAVLHTLLARPDRPCVVVGAESLLFLCPPALRLDLGPGTLVSLYPMLPCRIASTGLVWPTDGIDFSPEGRIGTSNATAGGVATLAPDGPGMLVILPRAALEAAVRALAGPPAAAPRWPARAG
ncbi:thiamine pyrophosphokinase [Wenxinia marina]|uniref:Thiamine pyrophosphokinase n=1 Tax=Wenxinia marina DSM 24838 TaxID=1123501 RepID=A0A0D0Q0W9_9RHOB|nr:thiamine pyrophosphokinase [Wenxinia marina]KIQ68184.1 Thiamine pyrophosphokinase [Wenxinia marina DSM 24838]GGL76606.1 thiamine pyrophosphokinase [Wenxinia marina]